LKTKKVAMKNKKPAKKSEGLILNGSWAEINAAKLKEMEEKEILTEQTRKNHFSFYISPDYNYSPTIEDFKEEILIQKITKRHNEYLLFLRETKKIYGNAYFYYQIWGARGTGYDRGGLYAQIIHMINTEIENYLNKSISQTEVVLTDKNQKKISANTLRRYKNYVDTFNNFVKMEKLSVVMAEKKTCEKHGISSKTLLRAIRAI
jgi:hypothetical protein